MTHVSEEHEIKLINAIEDIRADNLKQVSHRKYIDKIAQIAKQALQYDATRLMLLLQAIKDCQQACFKRDLLLDVLEDLFKSDESLVSCLMCDPFLNDRHTTPWKQLANAIISIPDLAANCNAQLRLPLFQRESFHRHLLNSMYDSFDITSKRNLPDRHKMYLIQMLGRISLSDSNTLLWTCFVSRALNETRSQVKTFVAGLLQLFASPDPKYQTFELFLDRIYLPIFFHLNPSKSSCDRVHSMLADCVLHNEHFKYVLCDKSIFKADYNLSKRRRSVLLFNIAAYLSSLVIYAENGGTTEERQLAETSELEHTKGISLLLQTLMVIVKQWASATKALLRTSEQNLHITSALLVMFRYALEYDKCSLAKHANELQSIIISAVPMYLNRASREQRDLAMCIGELLLPELRGMIIGRAAATVSGDDRMEKSEDLSIEWKFERTDDLLYLERLFKQNTEVLFQDEPSADAVVSSDVELRGVADARGAKQDASDISQVSSSTSSYTPKCDGSSSGNSGWQLKDDIKAAVSRSQASSASSQVKPIVELIDCETEPQANKEFTSDHYENRPRVAPLTDELTGAEDGNNPEDDYELDFEAKEVPIYLRDCINGLVENDNFRYVKLCLVRAGELLGQLEAEDEQADDQQQMSSQTSRIERTTTAEFNYHRMSQQKPSGECPISATIRDVGVELARTLLFMENQFNIEGFADLRLRILIALCVAAPPLVGNYLIEEFNGINRSMQQQLDILRVLIESAERLSGSGGGGGGRGQAASRQRAGVQSAVVSKKVVAKQQPGLRQQQQQQRINKFASYAALYFYGVVHRLKADFVDNKSLVISQPRSILTAFRELKCRPASEESQQRNSQLTTKLEPKTPRTGPVDLKQLKQLRTMSSLASDDIEAENVDKFLERNSLSDDSYLLSRILLATSVIISCASQQPVVCKLSSDLLEILAAYRGHPDSGVQKSMIVSLKTIKDCTPNVYYGNFIETRMVQMFGPWLARME